VVTGFAGAAERLALGCFAARVSDFVRTGDPSELALEASDSNSVSFAHTPRETTTARI